MDRVDEAVRDRKPDGMARRVRQTATPPDQRTIALALDALDDDEQVRIRAKNRIAGPLGNGRATCGRRSWPRRCSRS
jgi:hypothetical protein